MSSEGCSKSRDQNAQLYQYNKSCISIESRDEADFVYITIIGLGGRSSRKHLRTKMTPDFHLTYSKNGGNPGSESK